ncbi:MAG: AAA family ATPase, partial [Ruminococcus sp.]|nr:AAA family ATPase [Ruminococcus sp.]
MYLRSLELQGFKSFPERTKLEFNKGISAVVGPNGSGKSNIGDAMRWVMGESSSKSLRGKTMEDVIFSGTASRSKSGFAQVTITIDNEDRALSEDCDIVSVSRKLYRNGDSEYQINGRQVRRKDVDELFMDTGLGRDGYSIIGQGKIGEIVSSKASDRRQIFDEAAGISKFRSKKRETEEQLLKAEDNLSRLTDILGELEGRIGPLQKQCEKAKQFKVLDEEKSALEISLWVMRLKELDKQQKEFEEKLELLKKEYAEQTDALDEMEEQIEEGFAKSAQAGDRANQLREKIHEVELERSESTKKTAVLGNDIEHLEQRILQINEQIEQSRSSGYFLGTQLEEKKKELEERLNMSEKFQQDISDAEKKLTGAQYA